MYLDQELLFSDAQAATTAAATPSTNVVDLGAAGRDIGAGEPLWLFVSIDTSVTSAGAATVTFALQTDDAANFGSAVTLYTTGAIGKATLVAGHVPVKMRVPLGVKRYLRMLYTIGTADLTAGAWTAGLVKDVDAWKAYADDRGLVA